MPATYLESKASISPDGTYRYALLRRWAEGPSLAFVMLNPSTADAQMDDPTIRRCVGFGRTLGFGALEIGNLGALRATNPDDFFRSPAPIGDLNDYVLDQIADRAQQVIVAWGALPAKPAWVRARAEKVLLKLTAHRDVYALRVTAGGFPSHPLYLPADLKPVLFRARRRAA